MIKLCNLVEDEQCNYFRWNVTGGLRCVQVLGHDGPHTDYVEAKRVLEGEDITLSNGWEVFDENDKRKD